MSLDSDVVLIGTGVAPLIASSFLIAQGKSVLILNPDWDFFQEDSELPLDPLWPVPTGNTKLKESLDEVTREKLTAFFPGAIEMWDPKNENKTGFHDELAPHVRSRSRLWIRSDQALVKADYAKAWEALEDLYVDASDGGLNPQVFEGLVAAKKFPGFSGMVSDDLRGIGLPNLCDFDVTRYRNGILEFVRERLGTPRVIVGAGQIELIPKGIRFYSDSQKGRSLQTARTREVFVFWTPRMNQWIESRISARDKKAELEKWTSGIRIWEEWSLASKEKLDPGVIGVYEDMWAWAEVQGAPRLAEDSLDRLKVLRNGNQYPIEEWNVMKPAESWATAESFESLSRLCHEFMGWDKFSVLSMRPRALFEWKKASDVWQLGEGEKQAKVVNGCDGPLVDVVNHALGAVKETE